MINRSTRTFFTLLALETAALAAWFSGASSFVTWWLYGAALELAGPGPVEWLATDPLSFRVIDRGYHIAYWCTPTSLWTGGFLLLWAGAATSTALLKRSALYAVFTFLALAANLVLSVWLHPHVQSWYWGHIPGTVIIYVAAFITCLAWIARAPQAAAAYGHHRPRRLLSPSTARVPTTAG